MTGISGPDSGHGDITLPPDSTEVSEVLSKDKFLDTLQIALDKKNPSGTDTRISDDPESALELAERFVNNTQDEQEFAAALVAGFVTEKQLSLREYLNMLPPERTLPTVSSGIPASGQALEPDRKDYAPDKLKSIRASFMLTLSQFDQFDIEVASFMATRPSMNIDAELVDAMFTRTQKRPGLGLPEGFHKAGLDRMQRYGLLASTESNEGKFYSYNPLLKDFIREQLSPEDQKRWERFLRR
ncbi:MAG: hypothetical protein F6K19_28225 [Cyanothece sp. SIO1E1]|nr:hypothetical protein [Cyanothece sp. SIO1E1]